MSFVETELSTDTFSPRVSEEFSARLRCFIMVGESIGSELASPYPFARKLVPYLSSVSPGPR